MDIISTEVVVSLVVGAGVGFGIATAMGRAKFAQVQDEARNAIASIRRELTVAYSLIEGQAQELFDAATTKSRTTKK